MSHTYSTPSSSSQSASNFQLIINNALKAYQKRTKQDLLAHPLAAQLETCGSPAAILAVLQQQVQGLDQSGSSDDRWTKWLDPTINVLFAFSATVGAGVGLVFAPANVIFTGIGVLLSAARDVRASQDTLVNVFQRVESFFRRLEVYTQVPPTTEMMDTLIQIMVEILSILGIAMKEIKQGRMKKYGKKLIRRTDMEDALKRLDNLTQEEVRMAVAENLKATHAVDERVRGVANTLVIIDNRVADVDDQVSGVDARVARVDDRVAGVDDKVAGVDDRVARVDDKVAGVDDRLASVDDKVVEVINDGKEAKQVIDQLERNQLRENIHKWLSPPDPSTNHNIACDTHNKKTASWFFQGSIFREWKSTGSLLWIHGKPGSGKSILCSTIIEDIKAMCEAGEASMAYFYFDFRNANKQGLHDLFPSLLTQLSARSTLRCDILSKLYSNHDCGKNQPSNSVLTKCLKDMLTLPDQPPIYLIMDALDESPNAPGIPSPRERVLQLLKDLVDLRLPNVHICVTSRPEIEIRDVIVPLTSLRVSLHDQSGQKDDIADYVRSVVYSNSEPIMRRWKKKDKELVIEMLSERADGMFRWVFCQLEVLRDCLPSSVRRFLEELPESLDETYERVLREIKKPNRDHARRLLQCLVVAIRPLRVEELAEVLAVDFEDVEGIPKLNPSWRWEDQEQAVLTSCSSLIIIVGTGLGRVVQFSHFSVKEFLTSERLATSSQDISGYHIIFGTAHTIMAQACLSTLLRLDSPIEDTSVKESSIEEDSVEQRSIEDIDSEDRFIEDPNVEERSIRDISINSRYIEVINIEEHSIEDISIDERLPLARYAAEHWVGHAQFEDVASRIKGMEDLFDLDKPYFAAWCQLHDIDVRFSFTSTFSHFTPDSKSGESTPLYYAALCGFSNIVEQLIVKHPEHVNAIGGHCMTPAVAALAGRHFQLAQVLHRNGSSVEPRGRDASSPLHSAVRREDLEMVQVLLGYDVDVNAQAEFGYTPLNDYAAIGPFNDLRVTRLLLDHGADPNIRSEYNISPLRGASRQGKIEMARLLLEHGASIEVQDWEGKTPLDIASGENRDEMIKLLLEHRDK